MTCAPAASSAGNLAAAILPAPTSTTFRPASLRKIGRGSSGPASTGLEALVGFVELGFVIVHRGVSGTDAAKAAGLRMRKGPGTASPGPRSRRRVWAWL